jgi:hypothetical protein
MTFGFDFRARMCVNDPFIDNDERTASRGRLSHLPEERRMQ